MNRRQLIKLVTFLGGIYFFLEFILPKNFLGVQIDKYEDQISNGFIAVGAAAIGLGLINILIAHGSRIIYKRKGWFESSALLLGLLVMFVASALDWHAGEQISERADRFFNLRDFAKQIVSDAQSRHETQLQPRARQVLLRNETWLIVKQVQAELNSQGLTALPENLPASTQIHTSHAELSQAIERIKSVLGQLDHKLKSDDAQALDSSAALAALLGQAGAIQLELSNAQYQLSDLKQLYRLLYDGLAVSLGSAMFALLGFYIASAAYRAFRLQSMESGLMLGAALLVMLGQIPFGLWIWEGLPEVRLWILEVPNSAAFRAVKFGAAVAGLVMAFRMWFSIESDSFGGKQQ